MPSYLQLFRPFSLLAPTILLSACVLSGCSVVMALSGHKDPNLQALHVGSPKEEVEQELGQPKESHATNYGARTDIFEYETNNEPSKSRALMYVLYDVLTFGIAEVVFTGAELMTGEKKRLPIYYGVDGRVAGINETAPEIPAISKGPNVQPGKQEFTQALFKDLTLQLSTGMKEHGISRIAILPLTDAAHNTNTIVGNHLTDKLTTEFYRTASVRIVERAHLQRVMDELHLTMTGAFEETSAKRIGGLLGVDALVTGTYTELDAETMEVNARVVSVETAELAGVGSIQLPRASLEKLVAR